MKKLGHKTHNVLHLSLTVPSILCCNPLYPFLIVPSIHCCNLLPPMLPSRLQWTLMILMICMVHTPCCPLPSSHHRHLSLRCDHRPYSPHHHPLSSRRHPLSPCCHPPSLHHHSLPIIVCPPTTVLPPTTAISLPSIVIPWIQIWPITRPLLISWWCTMHHQINTIYEYLLPQL
jgi:hypothetical protein